MNKPPLSSAMHKLVNEGQITESDVLLKNGRIEKIATDMQAPAGAESLMPMAVTCCRA